MNPSYAQANIRAQLSILSQPPVAPLDINTGVAPQFWRSAGIQIDVGIFDGSGNGLDLSNLLSLQLTLAPYANSLVPWVVKSIAAGVGIVSPIDFNDWEDGLSQNASFVLTPSDTDLGLLAGTSRQFWMTISGTLAGNGQIIYGAGYITIYNAGSIYPPPAGGIVSWNAQNSSAGNPQVTANGLIHTEEINFSGAAVPRNIVLINANAYPKGCKVDILALLGSCPAGVVLSIYSGSITGSPIFRWETDGFQPNAMFHAVVNDTGGYDAIEQVIPAFI
jgi:hypothetical protein